MQTLVNIFLGFLIFKSVGAVPITDTIIYDSDFYDIPLGELSHPLVYDENELSAQLEVLHGLYKVSLEPSLLQPEQAQLSQPIIKEEVLQPSDHLHSPPLECSNMSMGETIFYMPHHRGLPACLLCTCLGTTVYCHDHELDAVPPLPKKTTYFYSRYNRIRKINRNDFANLNNLKRIDLTANFISEIHEDAFRKLPQLEELVLRDNRIRHLPELPSTLTFIDVSKNSLGRKGIRNEAFKDLHELQRLYITDNNLDHIPLPLPESLQALHLQNNNIQEMHEDTFCKMKDFTYIRRALEDIRLDGNPINLSKTPYAYMCLPRLPVGNLI
ncbi:EPYC protein, partial [Oreotrochilus melanogaster]|nr:EPYC protein [Oreotrochilus melanogaster]